jgi:general nucleoside transport system permease protein
VNVVSLALDRLRFGPREVARLGMALGILAFFFALPPIEARASAVPLLVGLLGMACGIWAVTRGEARIAWGAVGLGALGIVLGLLATRSSTTHLHLVVSWGALVAATLVWATPLTFAAIGGMFSERSGVVNIGLEGMMLAGAFFGVLGADRFHSWAAGLGLAAAAGGCFALLYASFAIHLRTDQIVGGTAINLLALGATGYFFIQVYGDQGSPGNLPRIPNVSIPGLKHVTFLGDAIGDLTLMIWLSFVLLLVAYVVMFKTPIGLRIRAVGEHPRAAETVGISVYLVRYASVTLSGVLAALGGAYLSVGFVGSFNENMTAGRGFIALAALIFGNWRPFGAFAAALLFGASTALSFRLATYSDSAAVLFQALPYVLTLIAVAGVIGRPVPPASVGRPYTKQ